MSINIVKINESAVIKLSDLIKDKQDLVEARKGAMKMLTDVPNPSLFLSVRHEERNKSLIFDGNNYLKRALAEESEWIVDRVYDNAIQNIEKEIALLAETVMKNLIESHKPY